MNKTLSRFWRNLWQKTNIKNNFVVDGKERMNNNIKNEDYHFEKNKHNSQFSIIESCILLTPIPQNKITFKLMWTRTLSIFYF